MGTRRSKVCVCVCVCLFDALLTLFCAVHARMYIGTHMYVDYTCHMWPGSTNKDDGVGPQARAYAEAFADCARCSVSWVTDICRTFPPHIRV